MPRPLSKKEIAEFRDQLCSAAERIYQKNGRSGLTMRELATALNVSAMPPYRYFHDKNEIISMLRTRAFEKFTSYMKSYIVSSAHNLNTVENVIDCYISFKQIHPDKYNLMFLNEDNISYKMLLESVKCGKKSMMSDKSYSIDKETESENTAFIGKIIWSVLYGEKCLREIGVKNAEACTDGITSEFAGHFLRGCMNTSRDRKANAQH